VGVIPYFVNPNWGDVKRYERGCKSRPAQNSSIQTGVMLNVTNGVANPVQHKTPSSTKFVLRTGLQTPSSTKFVNPNWGDVKRYERGCKPRPAQNSCYERGCKPRPAQGDVKRYERGCKPRPAQNPFIP
jgi:hypothetical protein